MIGDKKVDLMNGAFSKLRISGLTVIPSPEDNALALSMLENMLHEYHSRNICIGYKFEEEPDENSPSGIDRQFWDAIQTNLAVRLIPDYGKGQQPDPILLTKSNAALSFLSSSTALTKQVQPPRRMPIGSGNRRWYRWHNYMRPASEAPLSCETNNMIIGDIEDLTEDFTSYLIDAEVVSSYVLTADVGLTVVSESLATPIVSYRIQAVGSNNEDPATFYQVKIVATTDAGRVTTRIINFSLNEG